ncbi:SRPBCC family protein [Variovorax sp. HJSM1_2]|uniref:SRPBCC family protein n=1 Tax=Variovorax sp. HJSM1_2 TaxID=3366263 RepID=UPI003BCDAF04
MLRRAFAMLMLLAGCVPLWGEATSAAAADDFTPVADSDVHVEHKGNHFTVDLTLHTPAPLARAWAVLTDFEHMASIIPNLSSSEIIARGEKSLTVQQKGVARYGVFSSQFESIREIQLSPMVQIRAHGVGGNLQRADSLMQLEPEGTGTRLTYHAEAEPGFWFPPWIGPALVQHETAEQFNALLREMAKPP